MITTRTPVRISFLGGGTDYPAYFQRHGDATLVTTIDKYTYVTVQPLAKERTHRLSVHYERTEQVQTLDALAHPAVRETLRFLGIAEGVQLHLRSDLPVCTGLGTSSAFTVGLLHALHAYKGEAVSAAQLAHEAIHVEQVLIGERVGCQDQVACAHGGLLHLQFGRGDAITVTPLSLRAAQRTTLHQHLLLFYTGIRRRAHEVLAEQLARTTAQALDAELGAMAALVEEGLYCLTQADDLMAFGALLHEGWCLKRRFSRQVSNPVIDMFYARARAAGALGGKLLGAGSGGFLLFFAPPTAHPPIRQALAELQEVPFTLAQTGSEVVAQ
jgi:D-glycero-alpha-D-manno-heptose-7-phosphate kinase